MLLLAAVAVAISAETVVSHVFSSAALTASGCDEAVADGEDKEEEEVLLGSSGQVVIVGSSHGDTCTCKLVPNCVGISFSHSPL